MLDLYDKYGIDKRNQFHNILKCYADNTDYTCLLALFIRLTSILYNSKVLPYGHIWKYGSYEILYIEKWFSDVAVDMITIHANSCSSNISSTNMGVNNSDIIIDSDGMGSIDDNINSSNNNVNVNDKNNDEDIISDYKCLEWDKPRYYTNKYFSKICEHRDSFNYNDGISAPPTYDISNNGNDYYGDILTDKTLPHNYYDLITSTQVIEHISDSNKFINALYNALKEGGLLILTGPHVSPIHGYPHDYYRFTNSGINHLLTSNNFTIIQSNEYGNVLTGVLMILGIFTLSSTYLHFIIII